MLVFSRESNPTVRVPVLASASTGTLTVKYIIVQVQFSANHERSGADKTSIILLLS